MLVLSLDLEDKVFLELPDGREIMVQYVVKKRHDGSARIKLGFEAPDDVVILREKLRTGAA